MSTKMDHLLDGIDWQELPKPSEYDLYGDEVYATHQGVLTIGDVTLRCYILNDGTRLIDADDVHRILGIL